MAPRPEMEAEHLREKARKELLDLLEGVRGKKNLVISKSLTGPIGLFVRFSTLQDYGVDKVFVLENGNTDSSQRNIVYLVNGENASQIQNTAVSVFAFNNVPTITERTANIYHDFLLTSPPIEQIKKLQRNGSVEHEIYVIWIPRRTLVSNKILEDEGILGDVSVSELPLYFLALEDDVLSLELEDSFIDLYLRKDPTSILLASKALMQLQQRHGLFPRILGKGDHARKLANLLLRGRKESEAEESSTTQDMMPSTTVDSLVIVDRDVDFTTALLTQLTYEGLIDELVGIQHNQAEVDSSIAGGTSQASAPQQSASSSTAPPPTAKQSLKRKIQLDSSDNLFSQLRNTNFAVVGAHLNKVARRLEADYEGVKSAGTTSELKDFVNKLPGYQQEHQSLRIHTNLAEDMMKHTRSDVFTRVLEVQQNLAAGSDPSYQHETIEELISRDVPLPTVLRLLCLESTVVGGLRPRDLDSFKRQILHAYGFQHLLTLDALEKMELLQPRSSSTALLPASTASGSGGSKTNYSYLRKELRLIFDDVNEADPNDIAYVFSGYAPLSIRIVQCILQKVYMQSLHRTPLPLTPSSTGWQGFEDILKSAKGPTFAIAQKAGDEKAAKARTQLAGTSGWKTIFVFFLGGVTFAEIAALRFAAKQMEAAGERRRLVVLTTSIISGRSIMDGVMEKKNFATSAAAAK